MFPTSSSSRSDGFLYRFLHSGAGVHAYRGHEAQQGYSYIALQLLYWGKVFHINPELTNTTRLIASLLEEFIISGFSELELKAGHNT